VNPQDFIWTLLSPSGFEFSQVLLSESSLRKFFIGPLLQGLRQGKSLLEVSKILGQKNSVNLHHWEAGKRDMPLSLFLMLVDKVSGRLPVFCELVGFQDNLENFGFSKTVPHFSERFFEYPWTPSVFLVIQTPQFSLWNPDCETLSAKQLGISTHDFRKSLQILMDLNLIQVSDGKFKVRKGAFYAGGQLPQEVLDRLHLFWLSKTPHFYSSFPGGYHKVEQAALSRSSLEKIKGWAQELREKIREEIKTTEPETVAHFTWQVCDLFPEEKFH